jgi:hypothetical protein
MYIEQTIKDFVLRIKILLAKKAYIDNLNSPFCKIKPYKGQVDKKRNSFAKKKKDN